MNLKKKKELAKKTLGVGKNRITLNREALSEIKEVITKQDIRDLKKEGMITLKPIIGRRKIKKRKTKRGPGKIKKKIDKRKQEYVKITRKLRDYIKMLKYQNKIDREFYRDLRKKIRMRVFKSKKYLKDYIENFLKNPELAKIDTQKKSKKPKTKSGKKKK
ncbi:hypothetical protein GF386_00785 [Candidatus Pacearchaeota archaeon]|nr:hypothetical protein [Candidatus Pacearchaeota archaeon]MBD3282794.1 hypothetical protein [Candidatus Pacearchaeota archaeon]